MIKQHPRRLKYFTYYEFSQRTQSDFIDRADFALVNLYPHPDRKTSDRGAPQTHSREKLDFLCLKMTTNNGTYRDAMRAARDYRHAWDEPLPTHKTIVDHMKTISSEWLDLLIARSGFSCLEALAVNNVTAPLGCDSSAFQTTRYTYRQNQNTTLDNFMGGAPSVTAIKEYLKYHITAILGHQIILSAITTPSNVHDSTMLPVMLKIIQKYGFSFYGRDFLADRGYDAEENFIIILSMMMNPIIKQREYLNKKKNPAMDPKTVREAMAHLFSPSRYSTRALIEGIFGAEETKRHQLHCRFLLEETRTNFSKFRAIAWNLGVLHRFNCANRLGIPIPSYGEQLPKDDSGLQQTLA